MTLEELNAKRVDLNLQLAELDRIIYQREKLIADEEQKKRKQEAAAFLEKLRENKEFVLSLFEHDCTSCSDDLIANGYMSDYGYARCSKCFLTELLNGEWKDDRFEITFNVNIDEIT